MSIITSFPEPHHGSHLPFLMNGLNHLHTTWVTLFQTRLLFFHLILSYWWLLKLKPFLSSAWTSAPCFSLSNSPTLLFSNCGCNSSPTLLFSLLFFPFPSHRISMALLFPLLPLKKHTVLTFKLTNGYFGNFSGVKKIKQLALYNLSNLVSCYIIYNIFMRLLKPFCIFFFFYLTETFSHESMVFRHQFYCYS